MTRALILCLSILLLALLSAGIAPGFLPSHFWETRVENQLASQTGLNVDIDAEVRFQLLPAPAIEVQDLRLIQPTAIGDVIEPVLEAKSATAYLRPWPILFGDVRVHHLMLNQPTLRIGREDRHSSPMAGSAAVHELLSLAAGNNDTATNDNLPLVSRVQRLDIAGGQLLFVPSQGQPEVTIDLPNVSIERTPQSGELNWSARLQYQDWQADGDGDIDLSASDDGEQRRPFRSQWQINNAPAGVELGDVSLDGNLNDRVLSDLSVSQSDGWFAVVDEVKAPIIQSLSSALEMPLAVKLELNQLAIRPQGWTAQDVQTLVQTANGDPLSFDGQAALEFGGDGHELALSLSAAQEMGQTPLWQAAIHHRRAIAGMISASPNLNSIAFDVSYNRTDAKSFSREESWSLVGRLTNEGARFDQAEMIVPRSHVVEFADGLVPVTGDERWEGSLTAMAQGFAWLETFFPEAVVLGQGAEALTFDGEFWPRRENWSTTDRLRGRLTADGKRSFGLERQTLGNAKHLRITSNRMDLEWLPDNAQPVLKAEAAYAGPYVSTLLNRSGSLVTMAEALQASRFTLQVERGFERGQTFQDLKINVSSASEVVASTDAGQVALEFESLNDQRVLASLSGTLLSWRDFLSLPPAWLEDPRVTGDVTLPLAIVFQPDMGWQFRQDDRVIKLPLSQTEIGWQRDDISLQSLLAPLGPMARLFRPQVLRAEGTATPGNMPLGRAQLSTGQNNDGERIDLIWDANSIELEINEFAAFTLLPGLKDVKLSVETVNGTVQAWTARGDGWLAEARLDNGKSLVALKLAQASLEAVMNTLTNIDFQRGIASQADVSIEVEIDTLTHQDGVVLATDTQLTGRFVETALRLETLNATLANGEALSLATAQMLCTLWPCDFTWQRQNGPRTINLGPFEFVVSGHKIELEQRFFRPQPAEFMGDAVVIHLDQQPIEFSPILPLESGAWDDLFNSALGPTFKDLLVQQVGGQRFLATGTVKQSGNVWSTSNLLLEPSVPSSIPFTVLLDGNVNLADSVRRWEGQVLMDVHGETAILTVQGPIDQPTLGLLGAYFRE